MGADQVTIQGEITKAMDNKVVKKRPHDLLASLDAAFASVSSKPTSKYTSQAALQANAAANQQAYQHKRKRRNNSKQASKGDAIAPKAATQRLASTPESRSKATSAATEPLDPHYGRLSVDILQVGLLNCSLHPRAASMRKSSAINATMKEYLSTLTADGNDKASTDKLKNKVMQFDNPIRATDATKRSVNLAQAQSAKVLSARQRRKMGLHMIAKSITYEHAEKLCEFWTRYARDVLGSDFSEGNKDPVTRAARILAKLRSLDLSGCPVEVTQCQNPINVGLSGIVVSEKARILQVCSRDRSNVVVLPKNGCRLRISLGPTETFFVDGSWLVDRHRMN